MSTSLFAVSGRPLQQIQVGSSVSHLASSTSTYNASNYDNIILFTGAGSTLVLPSASSAGNITYKILNQSSGNITMTGPSFINGTGSMPYTLITNKGAQNITSDSINSWWLA